MGYDHTQRGMLHWLLLGVAALMVGLTWNAADGEPAVAWGVRAMAALFIVLAACFAHLRVQGTGDRLEIAFGPLALFRRSVRYADIEEARMGRSAWIDGWGIHRLPGRGWTWNIHGFEAVELTLRGGGRLRIGTDDSARLTDFLAAHIAPRQGDKPL